MRIRDPDGRLFRPSVVADVHVRYVSPLLPYDTFRVGVRVKAIGTSSVTFGYRVEAGDGRLAAEADSVEVMLDPETRRPRPIPDEARRRLLGT
jgi:acyl-CoA thioester hydrolase